MQILFYDPIPIFPYTLETLSKQALGGTEATILRIAQGLKDTHEVYIAQAARNIGDEQTDGGIHYTALETAPSSPDVIVLLRKNDLLASVAKRFPHAKRFVWHHNLPDRKLYQYVNTLKQYQYEMITVSAFHRAATIARLQGKWYQRWFSAKRATNIPIHIIYNPIDDDLTKDETKVKTKQMIFISSAYKGVMQTVDRFLKLHQHFPDYELLLTCARPKEAENLPAGVKFIGTQPHRKIIELLRESFCVFYPQSIRAETFGLIYAEANAVGTPVLAHDFGAAREILSSQEQVIDARNAKSITEKIAAWRDHRPKVFAQEKFRLRNVLPLWEKLF